MIFSRWKLDPGAWENCFFSDRRGVWLELVKAWLEHIGTSWGLSKSRNPTQTLCFPLGLPSACMDLWWDFHGLLMTIVIGLSPCGYGSHRTKKCRGRTSGWSAHTQQGNQRHPSREVSHRRWHSRARSRGGAHVMASWRRASHMLRCWYVEGLWVWPKGSQDVSLHLELGHVGTKSQQFHNKNSKKYVGRGLGLALRPCLKKNGRVKVCLES